MKYIATAFIGLFLPARALAVSITQYGWNCSGFLFCGTPYPNAVPILSARIIAVVAQTIVAVAVIAMIYGGLRMILSVGGEGKEAGKKAIKYAALGLIFALLANAIIQYVINFLYAVAN